MVALVVAVTTTLTAMLFMGLVLLPAIKALQVVMESKTDSVEVFQVVVAVLVNQVEMLPQQQQVMAATESVAQ
jgi:hypothetical protein